MRICHLTNNITLRFFIFLFSSFSSPHSIGLSSFAFQLERYSRESELCISSCFAVSSSWERSHFRRYSLRAVGELYFGRKLCLLFIYFIYFDFLLNLLVSRIILDQRVFSYAYLEVAGETVNLSMQYTELPLDLITSLYCGVSYIVVSLIPQKSKGKS